MKFNDKKPESHWHIYAVGKNKSARILVKYMSGCGFEHNFVCDFNSEQAKTFARFLSNAIADLEERQRTADDEED